MNPCDHDGLWREYHDLERALREKDAECEVDRAAIRALDLALRAAHVVCDSVHLSRLTDTIMPIREEHAAAIARAIHPDRSALGQGKQ